MQELLTRLTEKQGELGLSDVRFARLLGIPRETWGLTRRGTVPLGPRVAKAAMRAFPDLTPLAVIFLISDDTAVSSPSTTDSRSA